MTFRESFILACDLNPAATRGQKRRIERARKADPRNAKTRKRWQRMEARVAKRYEKETGRKVSDWGDGTIIQWLIDNLPAILQLIMSLLMMFGL